MPPRLLTVAIVAFWLASTAWFCQREVWPRLRSVGPAPFTVNLAREVEETPVDWDVFWKGRTVGHAQTTVSTVPKQEGYEVGTTIWFTDFKYDLGPGNISIRLTHLNTRKRVSATGQLQRLEGEVNGSVSAFSAKADGQVHWRGIVDNNGEFQPVWWINSPVLGERKITTNAVAVPNDYSTLNPLEPWNRLHNLEPGQRWRLTRFDPLVQSLSAMAGLSPKADYLDAGVLQDTDTLNWGGKIVTCLVIEYRGDNEVARTFVRQSDGLVLRQEVQTTQANLPPNDPDRTQVFALQRMPPDAVHKHLSQERPRR